TDACTTPTWWPRRDAFKARSAPAAQSPSSASKAPSLTSSSRSRWEVVTPPPCLWRSRRPHRPRPQRPLLHLPLRLLHRRRQPHQLRYHLLDLKRGLQRVARRDSRSSSAAACTESPVRTCLSGGTTAHSSWSTSPSSAPARH